MTTISVWVLVAFLSQGYSGGSIVVDNISTKEECEQTATALVRSMNGGFMDKVTVRYMCNEVKKVK